MKKTGMELRSILLIETIHVLLREIQALEIQILQVVIKKALTQLRVEGQFREMTVLQHDGHLPADLIEISLLRPHGNRDSNHYSGTYRPSESRKSHHHHTELLLNCFKNLPRLSPMSIF
jgi:hypothetical protein